MQRKCGELSKEKPEKHMGVLGKIAKQSFAILTWSITHLEHAAKKCLKSDIFITLITIR